MVEYCVYYGENGERCVVTDYTDYRQKLPLGAKWDYPDEVQLIGVPLIKRDKTRDEMTPEERKRRRGYVIFFAKDIPLSRALPKESN